MANKKKAKKTLEKKESEEKDLSQEQIKKENKQLKNIFIGLGVFCILIGLFFVVLYMNTHFNYNGIKFRTISLGKGQNTILLYETKTLLESNDGSYEDFGFRIRTKPSKLKKIPFEDLENFTLMKFNGYSFMGEEPSCNGDTVIAIPNFQRVFNRMGMEIVWDENSTCDEEGRYNFFLFKLGNSTEIKTVGKNCYEVMIKGDENNCEILPATEKLMVELFIKYRDWEN